MAVFGADHERIAWYDWEVPVVLRSLIAPTSAHDVFTCQSCGYKNSKMRLNCQRRIIGAGGTRLSRNKSGYY